MPKPPKRPGPGAPIGNRNAAAEDPRTSHLHIKLTPREKAGLVKSAAPGPLATYVRGKLGLDP